MVHSPGEPPLPHPGRAAANIRMIPVDEATVTLLTPLQKGALWVQIVFYCVTAASILAAGAMGTSNQSVWTAVIYHDTRAAPDGQEAGNVESLQEV